VTDRIDPRRPNQLEPFADDEPPGTLEEVVPEDPGADYYPDDMPVNEPPIERTGGPCPTC
jgi:hypothetical protein